MKEPAAAARPGATDRLIGLVLALLVVLVSLRIWTGWEVADIGSKLLTIIAVLALAPRLRWTRQLFVVLGALLAAFAWATRPDAATVLGAALERASFIAAFFCALATLRHAAEISPAIAKSARFLAQQPPGRRYATLSAGGQVFALILNYGSISLLGSMARGSANAEPDPVIRRHRVRRMLLAVHRGFASSLCWSPLGFAMVITLSVIPGADWARVVVPAIITSAGLIALGWGMDWIFKPKISAAQRAALAAARPKSDGVAALLPVLWLLLLIAVPVATLHFTTGSDAPSSVLIIVPLVAALWLLRSGSRGSRFIHLARHAADFCFRELPAYRGELVLLTMAGFLGSGAGTIFAPLVAASGIDLTVLPLWLLVIAPVWLIPLGGQVGMNPILFVSLFGPLLPSPEVLGISPAVMVVAMTGGWALSGLTSPFTASVMLVARLGDVSTQEVSLRWNGPFALIAAVLLSAWVIFLAY